jgi:DNA polymerase III delta prime subunit
MEIQSKKHSLWVEKYRPSTLEGYLGNDAFIGDLQDWLKKQDFPNLLLHGGPGSGKTTAAKLITVNIDCDYLYMNCSDENGIDAIRDKVKQFASTATFKKLKVVILDEADFLTVNAQAALRNIIETFSLQTRFIFTCNFVERIISPLQSRLASYALQPPTPKQLFNHVNSILDKENYTYTQSDVAHIVKAFYPDIRKVLNNVQACINNGNLTIEGRSFTKSNYVKEIVELTFSKDKDAFNKIRQIVADNSVRDFSDIYRGLYDVTGNPTHIITIAEGIHNSATSMDREITFMSTIAKLI